jgi:hypothetical protein
MKIKGKKIASNNSYNLNFLVSKIFSTHTKINYYVNQMFQMHLSVMFLFSIGLAFKNLLLTAEGYHIVDKKADFLIHKKTKKYKSK